MAFASPLALKVGEGGSRETPGTLPWLRPWKRRFRWKIDDLMKKRDEIDVRTYPFWRADANEPIDISPLVHCDRRPHTACAYVVRMR